MSREQILQFLKDNQNKLQEQYHVSRIGLIGSFARNEQSKNSDIDFLIEFRPGTKDLFELKNDLRNFLHKNLNHDIDLCREKYIKPYLKGYILKDVIYV